MNLFKKQDNLNFTDSINHNLILLLLYENIKTKKVFKYLNKINKNNSIVENSLNINGLEITQDNSFKTNLKDALLDIYKHITYFKDSIDIRAYVSF